MSGSVVNSTQQFKTFKQISRVRYVNIFAGSVFFDRCSDVFVLFIIRSAITVGFTVLGRGVVSFVTFIDSLKVTLWRISLSEGCILFQFLEFCGVRETC